MSHATITVAAIQLSSQADVESNLTQCGHWVEQAARARAELVVLPENFAYFGPDAARALVAEPLSTTADPGPGPIQHALSGWARRHRLTVVGGGMPIQSSDPERPYNTCVVFGPDGQLVSHYNKVHLFDVQLSD